MGQRVLRPTGSRIRFGLASPGVKTARLNEKSSLKGLVSVLQSKRL